MDPITLNTVINMIDNQLAAYKERMSAKGFDMKKLETPAQGELKKLKEHIQSFIEAETFSPEELALMDEEDKVNRISDEE